MNKILKKYCIYLMVSSMYNCAGWKRCGTTDEKYLIKLKIRLFFCKNKFD
tara:strand:+ start:542 stop:691 length:150 start_codon:yes stop_codon:yes gene_type:complete